MVVNSIPVEFTRFQSLPQSLSQLFADLIIYIAVRPWSSCLGPRHPQDYRATS